MYSGCKESAICDQLFSMIQILNEQTPSDFFSCDAKISFGKNSKQIPTRVLLKKKVNEYHNKGVPLL